MTTDLTKAAISGTSILLGIVYAAYQLHLLPRSVAKIVGRIYFFPTWPLTYISRRSNYHTRIDSHVFLGAVPIVFLNHIPFLASRTVRGVVNLCDEYEGPTSEYKKFGITQLWIPTIDHTEPSLEDIKKAVEFISFHKSQGSRVYVHCKAGAGRSAAVVFCWLLQSTGWSPKEVQLFLTERRRVRKSLQFQPNILAFYASIKQ